MEPETTAVTEAKGRRAAADTELQTLAKLNRILSDMDESERTRTLAWLIARHVPGNWRMTLAGIKEEAAPCVP